MEKCKQTEEERFDEFKKALVTFGKNCKEPNSRYKSWEYCYEQFYRTIKEKKEYDEKEIDFLCLHLALYLASWGMLRNSFLLERDYKIHVDVVKEILKYNDLLGIKCADLLNENSWKRLQELIENIKSIYGKIREEVYRKKVEDRPEKDVSEVLITKVLMGTLGCVPAYDRFFKDAIAGKENIDTENEKKLDDLKWYVAPSNFGKNSITGLVFFYESHKSEIESEREKMKIADEIEYPQMKLLDMGFWQLGFKAELQKKARKKSKKKS